MSFYEKTPPERGTRSGVFPLELFRKKKLEVGLVVVLAVFAADVGGVDVIDEFLEEPELSAVQL